MNVLKLKKEYEHRVAKIRKWNKLKEPKSLKFIKYLTIVLGVILASLTIFLWARFRNDVNKQMIYMFCIIIFELIYLFAIYLYIKRQPESEIKSNDVISNFDKERLKSLRRLLIKENICFDNVAKIQIIIDELIVQKHAVIPLYDIYKCIVNPLVIIFIPCFTVFLDHFTQHEDIWLQGGVKTLLLALMSSVLSIFFMFIPTIRGLLYRKYDDFISDLKLLQVINYK